MRRKDREMDADFALSVLDKCEYAVLATANPDGTPYCVPVNIVRDGDGVYFHCAKEGRKARNLRHNPAVCLTAVGDARVPPDAFTTEYESAVATGSAEEITGVGEKAEALRLLCLRHVPTHMDAFEEELSRSLARTAVWRIRIDTLAGKRNRRGKGGR